MDGIIGYFKPTYVVQEICLYDCILCFDDDDSLETYINCYKDSCVKSNQIDINAPIIFERTINPQIDPRTYVCIKVGDKQRDPLIIQR